MIDQLIDAEVADDDGNPQPPHRRRDRRLRRSLAARGLGDRHEARRQRGRAVPPQPRRVEEGPRRPRQDPVNAVEEVLRYWAPSQYQGRFSTADSEWHGVTFPAGQPVFLLTGAANRDEREYEHPDVFDIDRQIGLSSGSATGSTRASAPRSLGSRAGWRSTSGARGSPSTPSTKAGCGRVNMATWRGTRTSRSPSAAEQVAPRDRAPRRSGSRRRSGRAPAPVSASRSHGDSEERWRGRGTRRRPAGRPTAGGRPPRAHGRRGRRRSTSASARRGTSPNGGIRSSAPNPIQRGDSASRRGARLRPPSSRPWRRSPARSPSETSPGASLAIVSSARSRSVRSTSGPRPSTRRRRRTRPDTRSTAPASSRRLRSTTSASSPVARCPPAATGRRRSTVSRRRRARRRSVATRPFATRPARRASTRRRTT